MTGKERSVLDLLIDELREVRTDIKTILAAQTAYNGRAANCATRFDALESGLKWTRGKVWLIMGFGGGLGFAVGVIVKLVK